MIGKICAKINIQLHSREGVASLLLCLCLAIRQTERRCCRWWQHTKHWFWWSALLPWLSSFWQIKKS